MRAPLTDQELVGQCQAGELQAFGEIYDRHSAVVYRYAYRMTHDADEASDVMQDTFVKAYRTLPGFRGDCSLVAWLLKITMNICRDRYKMKMRRGENVPLDMLLDLPDRTAMGADPASLMAMRDMQGALKKVLAALPATQRELIVLRDLEELSYQEIAQVQGCSVASVKLRLFRARRSFRERMESLLRL